MIAGRQQGKSVTAVRWLLEQPQQRVLLTSSSSRRSHLLSVAARLLPATSVPERFFEQYITSRVLVVGPLYSSDRGLGGPAVEVGIDDAEEVLRVLFGCRVEFVTFNATLIPVVGSGTINGDFIDAEQEATEGHRPIRDNPQA